MTGRRPNDTEGNMLDLLHGRRSLTAVRGARSMRPLLATAGALLATGALATSAQAAFPGVNARVAYEAAPQLQLLSGGYRDDQTLLATAARDGSDIRPLVVGDGTFSAHDPAVSADGRFVAYVRTYTDGEDNRHDTVHVVGIDGSGDRELIADGDGMSAPTWSPDGTKIAFVQRAGVSIEVSIVPSSRYDQLVVVNADGTGDPEPVVMNGGEFYDDVRNPQWSPDGDRFAFDDGWQVYVVPAGGGDAVQPLPEAPARLRYPNWSPDGSAIVFEASLLQSRREQGMAIAGYDGDSFGLIVETDVADGEFSGTPTFVAVGPSPRRPAYSPDGLQVIYSDYAFESGEEIGMAKATSGGRDLYTVDAAGMDVESPSPVQRLFLEHDEHSATAPDWAPATPVAPVTAPLVVSKPPVVTVGGVKGDSARRCGSRRHFTIRLRPRGEKLAMARVLVNGKRVKVKPGKRWTAVVDLRSKPKKRFKVDITVWTKSGERHREVRRYWTCTAAIPPKQR
jgi:hypothetical protein